MQNVFAENKQMGLIWLVFENIQANEADFVYLKTKWAKTNKQMRLMEQNLFRHSRRERRNRLSRKTINVNENSQDTKCGADL